MTINCKDLLDLLVKQNAEGSSRFDEPVYIDFRPASESSPKGDVSETVVFDTPLPLVLYCDLDENGNVLGIEMVLSSEMMDPRRGEQ